jgi:hypothetical protein
MATKKAVRATKKAAPAAKAAKKAAPAARTTKKAAPTAKAAKKAAPAVKKAAAAPRRMAAKVSPLKGTSVEAYIDAKVSGWQAEAARRLVALVARVVPEAAAVIKWGQPVFEIEGPFAWLRPAKAHVSFGFWRGAEIADPKKLLEGSGDRMAHVKLASLDAIDEAALGAMLEQAARLNREKGDPTKRG